VPRSVNVGATVDLIVPVTDDRALPEWIGELVAHVAVNMESAGVPGPLGMQYGREDGFWQVTVFPQPVEQVGGADDGAVVSPGFTLDLEELRSIFEKVGGWKALGGMSWPRCSRTTSLTSSL